MNHKDLDVRLKYIKDNQEIENKINEVKRLLLGMKNYLQKKQ